jgi:hypothetical protein
MFGFDNARKVITFLQFHQESFVVTYAMNAAASTSRKVVFESEHLENVHSSWKARETYEIISADEFIETFEIDEPGKAFEGFYASYLRDADGNKLCVYHM